jgi:hypothetical protein
LSLKIIFYVCSYRFYGQKYRRKKLNETGEITNTKWTDQIGVSQRRFRQIYKNIAKQENIQHRPKKTEDPKTNPARKENLNQTTIPKTPIRLYL